MPAGDQPRLQPGLLLQHELAQPLGVVQPGRQQHVPQDVQQRLALVQRGLAAQHEVGGGVAAAGGGQVGRAVDAARLAADALRQLDEILTLGAHAQQQPAEQLAVGQQALRQAAQVEAQVQVEDAVGEQVVGQQPRAGQLALDAGNAPDLPVQVGQGQGRDGGQRLGRVGGVLQRLEALHGGLYRSDVSFGHGCARCVQPGALGRLGLRAHARVGLQQDHAAMRVVQQVALNQRLEEAGIIGRSAA